MKKINLRKMMTLIFSAAVISSAVPVTAHAEPLPPISYIIETTGEAGSGNLNYDEDFNVADAVVLRRHLLNLSHNFDESSFMKADLNLDGTVDIFDFIKMRDLLAANKENDSIAWEITSAEAVGEFQNIVNENKEYAISSSEELQAFINEMYYNKVVHVEPISTAIELEEKYNDAYFENNVLLIKPLMQTKNENDDDILYNINRIYYENNILNIDYTFNYDSLRYFEQCETGILAQVSVPKSLYCGENVSWNYYEKDWYLGYGGCCIVEPVILQDDTFKFENGDQTFYVDQTVSYYEEATGLDTDITFYTYFEGYKFLDSLSIHSDSECYTPFSDSENFQVTWRDNEVEFSFTADDTYTYCFDYIDKTVRTQTITYTTSEKSKDKAIASVDLTADCAGSLAEKADIQASTFTIPNRITGRAGLPVRIKLNGAMSEPQGVIHYNEAELPCDENNLVLLYYNTSSKEAPILYNDEVLDTENNTLTFDVDKSGVYLLADKEVYDFIVYDDIESMHIIDINDGVLTRTNHNIDSLTWNFIVDGEFILKRSAVKETELDLNSVEFFRKYSGCTCTVYLTMFSSGKYVKTSNELEIIIP